MKEELESRNDHRVISSVDGVFGRINEDWFPKMWKPYVMICNSGRCKELLALPSFVESEVHPSWI